MLAPATARADDMDDLILGRESYVNGEYPRAAQLLRPIANLDASTPRLAAMVTTARKFYAACLFAQRQTEQVRGEFARMLRDDPDARLEQTQFDPEFVRLFESVLRELQPELDRMRIARVVSQEQATARRVAREELLHRMLTTESVEVVPWGFSFIPYGVAQFANGQRGLGWFFAITEVVLTAVSATTFAVHGALYPPDGRFRFDQLDEANLAVGLRVTNYIATGGLVAAFIAGFVQAQVAYEPVRRINTRPRPIPPELQNIRLMAGPSLDGTGASMTLRLTF